MGFNKDFVWGVAATAYQIEGAAFEDGRGLSVWDMFCNRKGKIFNGQNGDVACDHYHRYKEDVKIMANIGVKAYELSVAWSRVLPEGIGKVNRKGLDFYNNLIDELLKYNIVPFLTIYHWEMPYDLYCKGGWLNNESPDWFAEYTKLLVETLSDRVEFWLTHNEPQCFIGAGHLDGVHAPGDKLGMKEVLRAGHNSLIAHGKSVQTIRAYAKKDSKIGMSPVGLAKYPATNSKEDINAAKKATFSVTNKDCWNNTWWMDPIYLGKYPEDGLELFGRDAPDVGSDDMKIINQPLDFCGLNIYFGDKIKTGKDGKPEEVKYEENTPHSAFNWFVTPEILYWGPKFFYERYNLPIYITENGMSLTDWVSTDGKVHDPQRIDFIKRHLRELERASDEGIDIKGYFHWSILDNFEWASGYNERFGLTYVDYKTQKRIMKDSAYYYKDIITSNGECIKNN